MYRNNKLQEIEFTGFVQFLKAELSLNDRDISQALAEFQGLDGVMADRAFILAYDRLARLSSSALTASDLPHFVAKHCVTLGEDEDARFFFCRALLENVELSEAQRKAVIDQMPEPYQPSLRRWFRLP